MAITKHLDEQVERLEKLQKNNTYTGDTTLAVAIEQALALAYIAREIARK
jgi:hypothetical protein